LKKTVLITKTLYINDLKMTFNGKDKNKYEKKVIYDEIIICRIIYIMLNRINLKKYCLISVLNVQSGSIPIFQSTFLLFF